MTRPQDPVGLFDDHAPKARAVLEVAVVAFAERGFHGTNIPSLAQDAEVGVGTVYRHFGDKKGLVNAVLQAIWTSMKRQCDAVPTDVPARDWHRALFVGFIDWMRLHPAAARFVELHPHRDYIAPETAELKVQIVTRTHAVLARFAAEKAVKSLPPAVLTSVVWGTLVQLVRGCTEGLFELDEPTIDAAEQCCWEAVRL